MKIPVLKMVFHYALRDISRSGIIFFLTVMSLSVIFTAIFLTGGILEGFGSSLSVTQIESIGELVVLPEGEDAGIENLASVENELKKIENIKSFSVRNSSVCLLEHDNKKIGPYFNSGLNVKTEALTSKFEADLTEGRFLKDSDRKKVVLGATLADALVDLEYDNKRVPVGAHITLTSPMGKKWEYEVVGIIDAKTFYSNWVAYMTSEEIKSFSNINDAALIAVKLKDGEKMEATIKEIEAKNLPVEIRSWKKQSGFIQDIITVFNYITGSIIVLLSISIFMVTSVILYINFLQYRRQIGILKSMGTSDSFIILVYMTEAGIFTILSFGIAFSVFYFMNLDSNNHPIPLLIGDFHTSLEPSNILMTFIILMISSMGGSVIPAYIATKTNIVDVIRDA